MSLDVSPKLLSEAEAGDIREENFVDTIRTSLPYAYDLVASSPPDCTQASPSSPTTGPLPPPNRSAASSCAPSPATPSAAAWNATST